MYRCYICDFSEATPSIYHSSLVSHAKRVKFDVFFNEYVCNDCAESIYQEMPQEEGEVEYIDERDDR